MEPNHLIIRGSEHQDGADCPYYNKMKVYSTPNAFIIRGVLENYLESTIFKYIEKIRGEIQNLDEPVVILYDGQKGHISDILFSKCAEKILKL